MAWQLECKRDAVLGFASPWVLSVVVDEFAVVAAAAEAAIWSSFHLLQDALEAHVDGEVQVHSWHLGGYSGLSSAYGDSLP